MRFFIFLFAALVGCTSPNPERVGQTGGPGAPFELGEPGEALPSLPEGGDPCAWKCGRATCPPRSSFIGAGEGVLNDLAVLGSQIVATGQMGGYATHFKFGPGQADAWILQNEGDNSGRAVTFQGDKIIALSGATHETMRITRRALDGTLLGDVLVTGGKPIDVQAGPEGDFIILAYSRNEGTILSRVSNRGVVRWHQTLPGYGVGLLPAPGGVYVSTNLEGQSQVTRLTFDGKELWAQVVLRQLSHSKLALAADNGVILLHSVYEKAEVRVTRFGPNGVILWQRNPIRSQPNQRFVPGGIAISADGIYLSGEYIDLDDRAGESGLWGARLDGAGALITMDVQHGVRGTVQGMQPLPEGGAILYGSRFTEAGSRFGLGSRRPFWQIVTFEGECE